MAAADTAAATGGVWIGLLHPSDPDTPGFRSRFQVFPPKLVGALGLELIKQRFRIVIIHQNKAVVHAQLVKKPEDFRVAFTGDHRTDIKN